MKMSKSLQLHVFLIITETFIVAVTTQQNLALQGNVKQETTFIEENGTVHSANLAIEGPVNNNWNDGCSSTQPGGPTAWWGLFLPEVAYITNVVIYFRGDKPDQMDEFRLYLSNTSIWNSDVTLCYTDRGIAGLPDTTQNINCNIVAKQVYFFNRNRVVQLCYIQINGCFKGTWGTNCSESCHPKCINQHCYPENGSCVWGCNPHHCANAKCDIKTGDCIEGCANTRAGQSCNFYNLASNGTAKQDPPKLNSSASLSIDGIRKNGMCSMTTGIHSYLQVDTGFLSVISTIFLTFGDTLPIPNGDNVVYCSNTSDSWVDGIVLYKGERPTMHINVLTVCRYIIYVPPAASGISTVDVCEIEIGGCPLGRYGINCENYCYCNGPCDLVTGSCTFGCFNGWIGERCDIACAVGNFGRECGRSCSANCLNLPCNHISGECTGGCNIGWEGYNCTKECDIGHFGSNCSQTCFGCISDMCDKVNGVCKNSSGCKAGYLKGQYCNQECAGGNFGSECSMNCSANCLTPSCNHISGDCEGGCNAGWEGYDCTKECSNGYFGNSCTNFCKTCFNISCDIVQGNCKAGCIDGYRGRQCTMSVLADTASTDCQLSTQIGLFIGALLLGAILAVGIMSIIIRRRICTAQEQKNKAADPKFNEKQYDNLGMETVSTYQDLTSHSIPNDYDQINTQYVNQ
ncbi:multiple epidermal growth factor-like domains protein 11 isoform X2 [Mytilus californianus]|uniref:multiple epidermal growth factor-like domains protein 11 isoform X2 n=1 Tax=Mytilus californianus TaxID=6549 RepID=UPI0022486E46|nr:multiple epidermal growth factor-like domains protein 11 isoform X2 [Mytilus californianus]